MTELETIGKVLAFVVAFIVTPVAWLMRLENRVNANARELTRLEKQIENDRAEARANRAEQNDMLREMQRDIKLLLGRGAVQHHTDRTLPPR
ncbi:hypothetical protein PE067_08375 [Paracoccus sp. DMF-8]|uniref:hypothetical protein n=1 Tax=Paracoccus sp. DMF-8 TaxID=3019445 RepID=UPI0023E7F32F|nr:hypothetical protein [Paracoccus sp. DMF-8]MDF3606142.1 hypothetical protein [Paracoccus sp. DMF-8]